MIQENLKALGLYDGTVDGIIGDNTRSGLVEFLTLAGLPMEVTEPALRLLSAAAEVARARDVSANTAIADAGEVLDAIELLNSSYNYNAGDGGGGDITAIQTAYSELKRLLGERHRLTLTAMFRLGVVYDTNGQPEVAEPVFRELHQLRAQVLGENDPDTLTTLNSLAITIENQGRYAEAEQIYAQLEGPIRRALGVTDPDALMITYNKANSLREQGRLAEAEAAYGEAYEIARPALGPDHWLSWKARKQQAHLVFRQNRYAEAEAMFSELLADLVQAFGQDDDRTLSVETLLAVAIDDQGRHVEAERILRRVVELRERNLGPDDPETLYSLQDLATSLSQQGRYREAETIFRRVFEKRVELFGPTYELTLGTMGSLANSLGLQGRYADEEELRRREIRLRQEAGGDDRSGILQAMNSLGANLMAQGRYADALALLRSTEARAREVYGPDSVDTARIQGNLALALEDSGAMDEAGRVYAQAYARLSRALGEMNPDVFYVGHNYANYLRSSGDLEAAADLYDRVYRARVEVLGADHPDSLGTGINLGGVLEILGRLDEAKAMLERSADGLEHALGANHPTYMIAKSKYAKLLARAGQTAEAERILRQLLADAERNSVQGDGTAQSIRFALLGVLGQRAKNGDVGASATSHIADDYVDLIFEILSEMPRMVLDEKGTLADFDSGWAGAVLPSMLEALMQSEGFDLTGEVASLGFELGGWLTYGDLDVTLGDLGSRSVLGSRPEAAALRSLQETRNAVQRARQAYLASVDDSGMTAQDRLPLAAALSAAEEGFDKARKRIDVDFPALAELRMPQPLKAYEARAMFRQGDGLLTYVSTGEAVFAWLVTRDWIEWQKIEVSASDLSNLVSHLRDGLDQQLPTAPEAIDQGCALDGAVVENGYEHHLRPFDLCAAQELHDLLLGQFDLTGIEELIVVPDGALEQVPFSLLVTGTDADGSPHWLIEDRAISTLPTTSSLQALRQAAPARDGQGAGRRPYLGLAPVTFRDFAAIPALSSGRKDLEHTADEVRFISGVLAAGPDGAVTGAGASEAWLRSADLSRYDVISFATHALLSREAEALTGGALTEPALLLHPGDGQDGFLTASEAAGLRLDADWVLLSACNTAAGEAEDAEGLSGLARAFFFAGAKALMVSHWNVDDAAAMALMTETMQRSANGRMSRAQALRQAMLTVMNSPDQDYRHPFFWAPFVLVGESGR